MHDHECLQRARNGDLGGFRDLFDRYRGLVYRIGLNVTGNKEDAEDALQETFLRLHRGIRQVDAQKPLKPYICRIAANCALNIRRHRASATRVEEAYGASRTEEERPPAEGGTALMATIETVLPEQQGKIFALKHFAGLTIAEIAEAEGCAEGTVKANLHFAVAKLRKALKGLADETD